MKPWRVLIFPAGTEIAMEIFHSLRYAKEVELFGASSVPGPAEMLFERYEDNLPMIAEADFLPRMNVLLQRWDIDFVYPAYDAAQLFLVQHEDELAAKVVSSPLSTVETCRSKEKTYRYFSGEKFVPRVYAGLHEVRRYPVFAKPKVGQGSEGVQLLKEPSAQAEALGSDPAYLLCEYLPGEECTVDCFTDSAGKLLTCSARSRERMKNGISMRSSLLPEDERVKQIAAVLNERLHFLGAWFFQIKRDTSGDYKLLEVSPRIPGTMGVTRQRGINAPLLTLYVLAGMQVQIFCNDYGVLVERTLVSRYELSPLEYDDVYLDYDDTLILRGKVNTVLLGFLYQAVDKGKKTSFADQA